MTTTVMGYKRDDRIGDVTVGAGGAIAAEVQLVYEDELDQSEVIIALDRLRQVVMETPFPRV